MKSSCSNRAASSYECINRPVSRLRPGGGAFKGRHATSLPKNSPIEWHRISLEGFGYLKQLRLVLVQSHLTGEDELGVEARVTRPLRLGRKAPEQEGKEPIDALLAACPCLMRTRPGKREPIDIVLAAWLSFSYGYYWFTFSWCRRAGKAGPVTLR